MPAVFVQVEIILFLHSSKQAGVQRLWRWQLLCRGPSAIVVFHS